MTVKNQHILSFRANDELVKRVLRFAMDNGLYNAEDQPNVSAALLLLVSAGLQDYRGQEGMVIAYEAARGSVLSEVKRELNAVLVDIANRIR